MPKNRVKIISLVPSWTETFLETSIQVVGRTRFCIHPEGLVKNIPIVGGTKNIDLKIIQEINPNFIVLDQQENTKEMADQLIGMGFKLILTDVTDFDTLIRSCTKLGHSLQAPKLIEIAERFQRLAEIDSTKFLKNIILKGSTEEIQKSIIAKDKFEYLIWKKPFMVVGKQTFIAANLKLIGIHLAHDQKYPEIADLELKKAHCLFSSEPFPFSKDYNDLIQKGFRGVLVDAEKLSWFGIRNLKFLEASQKLDS